MALENEMKRIADALEKLVELASATPNAVAAEVKPAKPAKPAAPAAGATAATTGKKTAVAGANGANKTETGAVDLGGDAPPTLDNIMDALRAVVTAKGAPRAKEILAEYGAAKVSDLKAEVYTDVFNKLNTEALA